MHLSYINCKIANSWGLKFFFVIANFIIITILFISKVRVIVEAIYTFLEFQ